tara:strand:- start:994 stop:4281 length:3288 start_codon:yes stop_codon:yes gene_type:complete
MRDYKRQNGAFWFCKKKQYNNVINRAITYKNNKEHKVLVSRDRTFIDKKTGETRYIKAFGSYKTVDKVVEAINKYGNFNLYEVLEPNTPLKMYYDIEFPHETQEKTNNILINLVKYTKKIITEIFGFSECFDDEDISCSGSIGKGKLRNEPVMKASYHFSFQCGSYFRKMNDLQIFMSYLQTRMNQEKEEHPEFFYTIKGVEECVVDWTVYKKNQQIKLPLQSKLNSPRVQGLLNDTDKLEDHFYGYYGDIEYPDYFDISKVPEIVEDNNNNNNNNSNRRGGYNNTKHGNIHKHFKAVQCIPEGEVKYDDIDYLIDSIDNSDYNQNYIVFIGMCCCIKNVSDNDDIGFQRFLRWYKKSSYFKGEYEARRVWNSTVKRSDGYNVGTLRKLAVLCNPKLKVKNPIKELTEIHDIKFKTEIYNEKYQRPYNTDDYDCIVAESPMGSGKTFQIAELLKKIGLNKKILVLSPRRCFARSIASELTRKLEGIGIKFTCYLDLKSYEISKCQYLVCQMESLHLLENNFDILIADEFTSCLTQLSSTGTMGQNIKIVSDKFKEIWNNASKKIVCDAFINDKVIKFIEDVEFKGERKKRIYQSTIDFNPKPKTKRNQAYPYVLYMKNEVKPVEREAVELKLIKENGEKIDVLLNKLVDSLKNKKKCVFVTASRDKGLKYLETIKKELDRKFTYKFYHSKNKEETENDLKNVNKYWKVDLLIYTSSITVGVNFDIKWFDELFIYSSCCAGIVRDTFQSSMRVRHLKDNIMYYQLWTNTIDLDNSVKDDKNKIKEQIKLKILEEQNIEEKVVKKKKLGEGEVKIAYWDNMPLWLYNIHIQNKFEDNISILKHRDLYLYYLKKLNYKLINNTFDLEDIEIQNINSSFLEYNEMKMTQEEEDRILNKKETDGENMTEEELNKYQKIKFNDNVNITDKTAFLYKYFFDPSTYNVNKYYNLRNENRRDVYSVISKERRDRKFIELSDSRAVKLHTIKNIMKELGMKSSTQLDYKIDRQTLETKYDFIINNAKRWNNIFRIKKKKSKNKTTNKIKEITNILSPIFKIWSGSTFTRVERKQKRINKKRVDCSIYGLNVPLDIDISKQFKTPL